MDAKEIIAFIQNAEKKTPVKVYLKEKKPVAFPDCKVFGTDSRVIFGDWKICLFIHISEPTRPY